MGVSTGKLIVEERLSVAFSGACLEIIATECEVIESCETTNTAMWSLAIENEHGVRTVWHHKFVSASAAIDAGVRAIEEEGITSFTEMQDFQYLIE